MKYIADVLTLSRFMLAVGVPAFIVGGHWTIATIMFAAGILTDAIDGAAARLWPHDKTDEGTWFWRRNPHAFDMAADGCLWFAGLVGTVFTSLPVIAALATVTAWGTLGCLLLLASAHYRQKKGRLGDLIELWGLRYPSVVTYGIMLVVMTSRATSMWPFWCLVYGCVGVVVLWYKRDKITTI